MSNAIAEALLASGADTPVDVVVVDEIERDPGHAAKMKLVRSEVVALTP